MSGPWRHGTMLAGVLAVACAHRTAAEPERLLPAQPRSTADALQASAAPGLDASAMEEDRAGVLALRLVTFEGRQVVDARLVGVAGGIAIEDLEETVDGTRRANATYSRELLRRLSPPPAPAWYESSWLWTGTAAVVGGSVSTAVLIVSSTNDNVIRIGGR